jgi:hypothetical protein
MKLQELAVKRPTQQIAKVFESHYGQRIPFDSMNLSQARTMLGRVRKLVNEHRANRDFHQSERNPAYIKLMMMEQALSQRLFEEEVVAIDVNDPAMKAIQTKIKNKQVLNPDEQKKANAILAMQTSENNTGGFLKESEVQQAQVVLAAQDMVDKMQKMIEDTTSLQFKELPALVDSIKNQVGVEQAAQFNNDATAALAGLVQNLQNSKLQMEQALGVVTGQAAAPVVPGAEAGAELGAELGADAGAELGAEDDLDAMATDAADDMDPELGAPMASLGRERR